TQRSPLVRLISKAVPGINQSRQPPSTPQFLTRRAIIGPNENPNHQRKVRDAKWGDTTCVAMINRSNRSRNPSASIFTFKYRTAPAEKPSFECKRAISTTQRIFSTKTGQQSN